MNTKKEYFSHNLNKLLITFVLLAAFLFYHNGLFANEVQTSNESPYHIALHNLEVSLDVISHSIIAKDSMVITLSAQHPNHIAFMLNNDLVINKVGIEGHEGLIEWDKSQVGEKVQKITVQIPETAKDKIILTVEYAGEIYDPVITAKELGHLRGDVTAGLISEKGVYLAASTYWYPVKLNELSLFNINVKIADPYRIVTQGELKNRQTKDGFSISKWESHVVADGLALVGGKYTIHSKTVDNVTVSTYFFEEDDSMSDLFLNAAIDYIKLYSGILGPYPYKKFDVVENFFSTGYGMPSYTLLGNYVIKRGRGSLQPGYLDHEIVHSWFGNYVFNDARKGNWVEALTTYCANYYYKELKLGETDAIRHRKNASLKYSIRVSKDNDYAVHEFVTKTKPFDNEIGYTKGSMVFHQLRRTIGDDNFFKGLRALVKKFGGKYAEWEDIQSIFEHASKANLGEFFFQWVDVKGAPELRLENVSLLPQKKGYLVKGEVVQLGNIYKLTIPIHIDLGNDTKIYNFDIDSKRKGFEYETGELPISVALDPEYHLFRRIAAHDITPCFNAFLEDKNSEKLLVFPTKGTDTEKEIYHGLVKTANKRIGGTVISGLAVTPAKLRSSIFFTGETRNQESCKELFNQLPAGVKLGNDSFTIDGDEYKGAEYALLFTYRNPQNRTNFITTYFGLSPQAISRARYIFFYGWDSYIVFKNGRPVKRGSFRNKKSDTVYNFPVSLTAPIKSENIMKHIEYLASTKLAGRYPGTEGSAMAEDYIKNKFRQYQIPPVIIGDNDPYEQKFKIKIIDLKNFHLTFQHIKTAKSFKQIGVPFNFSPEGNYSADIFFAGYGISDEMYNDYENVEDDVKGKAVVILDGTPDFLPKMQLDQTDLLFSKIALAEKLGAEALIIYASTGQIKEYAPYLAYQSKLPTSLNDVIKRKKQKGSFASSDMELVSLIAKAKKPSKKINIPVVLMSYEDPAYKTVKKYLKLAKLKKNINKNKRAYSKAINGINLNMSIKYQAKEIWTKNIVAMLEGNDPEHKNEIVVLGAHYDHLGTDEKGNVFFGADDNASGVGALLEIAKVFYEFRDQIKRTVVFVAFGAEEWGLLGSRFFINNVFIDNHAFQDKKISAMLNMDSIGKGDASKVWIIGSSIYPELGSVPNKFLEGLGLQEGDNIDKYAFTQGSDHYPFHLKAIPAIDFFSTNYRELHKITDTWKLIDDTKVEKVCKLVFMTLFDLATK
ncbi:MAG: M20/M25/M40 family metallo-hydrolase [Candidatus Anammoxibacter sp.]